MNINIQISAFLEVKKLLEHNTLYHSKCWSQNNFVIFLVIDINTFI